MTTATLASTCVICAQPYTPRYVNQKTCLSTACKRKNKRRLMLRWHAAHPAAVRNAIRRFRTFACPGCGRWGERDVKKSERAAYRCAKCRHATRLALHTTLTTLTPGAPALGRSVP